MKRVVFIPTYYYLSHSVFYPIADFAKGIFKSLYFNTCDELFSKVNEGQIIESEILCHFAEYHVFQDAKIQRASRLPANLHKISNLLTLKGQKQLLWKKLSSMRPNAIVTTSDMGGYINRLCNAWAASNAVPFVVIQPSLMDVEQEKVPMIRRLKYFLFNKCLGLPLFRRQAVFGNERESNYLLLWGDFFKKYYSGLPIEKNIFFCGNPAFDEIVKTTVGPRKIKINVLQDRPTVLICTDCFEDPPVDKALIDIYRDTIHKAKDLSFIIKLHPRDDPDKFRNELDCENSNLQIVQNAEVHDLFSFADVQVSAGSTTSFHAILNGVPVVLLNPGYPVPNLTKFFQDAVMLEAKNSDELLAMIRIGLSPSYKKSFLDSRDKYLNKMISSPDGNSTETTVKILQDIISKNYLSR